MGYGRLLVPKLGMVAVYEDGQQGYVRHLDNERVLPLEDSLNPASDWRNFRVLVSSAKPALRALAVLAAIMLTPRALEARGVQTAICYLNPEWGADDGGRLRCYERDAPAGQPPTLEVEPAAGTVVLFPSCLVPHEVLPARRRRYAVTLWFVSSSLLRGTPVERAAAVEACAGRRRKRGRDEATHAVRTEDLRSACASGSPAAAVDHAVTAVPRVTAEVPATASLAVAWEADAEVAGQGGGGFSFGFTTSE